LSISLLLHGAAVFAVTQTSLQIQWIALASCVILFSAYFSHKLNTRSYRLQWREDRHWEIRYPCGDKRTGKMLRGTFFNPLLIILALRTGSTRKDYILIPRDSIPESDYTRLRARLKIEAKKAITS
jgi:hypothetical protein